MSSRRPSRSKTTPVNCNVTIDALDCLQAQVSNEHHRVDSSKCGGLGHVRILAKDPSKVSGTNEIKMPMNDAHAVAILPKDDGEASHLKGSVIPTIPLQATDGTSVYLHEPGLTVVYAYPRTSPPDGEAFEGWDAIPGARGCTPQSCAFRDHFHDLQGLGVNRVFGLSTQTTEYQIEAAARLHLPFPLLSDQTLAFASAMRLPRFECAGLTLLKRLTMVIEDGRIEHVFYPVFPPERNVDDVIDWLAKSHRTVGSENGRA